MGEWGHQRLERLQAAGATMCVRTGAEGYIVHPKTDERFHVRFVDWDETKQRLHPGSLAHRLLERINADPTHLFSADDFEDMQNESGMPTIRSGLLRLYNSGSIERPRRGRFKATKAVRDAAKTTGSGGAS